MGKAEDVFKARREADRITRQKEYEERCKSTREVIEPLIPKIVANLEKFNYPRDKYPFYRVELLKINGEERVGWELRNGDPESRTHDIHILADGSLVIERERVIDSGTISSHRWPEQIIETLRNMANYQP